MTQQTLNRNQTITRFASGPSRLAAAIECLSEKDLDLSLSPGEWSIREIVHHLADGNDIWSTGLKKAIAASGALLRFEGYPGNDAWAEAMHYKTRPIRVAMTLYSAHIQMMAQLVAEFPSAWDNTLKLADQNGTVAATMTVGAVLDMLSKHFEEHLEIIQAIKRLYGLEGKSVKPVRVPIKLTGANMDIDLATPKGEIAWTQMKCPWNEAEQATQHHCAVKNTSICQYFCGVQPLDTLLCSYPHGALKPG